MWHELLIVFFLILGNGLFAGAEMAVVTLRRSHIAQLAHKGGRAARGLQRLRAEPERFLATVQVGITVVGAASAAYGGAAVAARLAGALERMGLGESAAYDLALALVVAAISYLSLVLGELVPKSLALHHAERYALFVGRPLLWLAQAMRPVVWLLTASSNLVLRMFGDSTTFTEARVTREELQELLDEAGQTGSVDPGTSEIARRAFALGELSVSAVMVPRSQIIAVPRRATTVQIQRILLESGHSRMPVYDGDLDNVIGIVIAKDVLALIWERQLLVLDDILRPPCFVPASMRILDVLRELQRNRTQLAIVRDADGGVAGLVTGEDMVEEMVGELFSEDETDRIRREAGGTALVHGTVPVREVNRELELELPESEAWSTIAGLCIAQAGWLPAQGTKLPLERGVELEIVEATGRRIEWVRIRSEELASRSSPPPPPESPPKA